MLAIKNGKLVLENGIIEGKAVILSNKIEAIVDECDLPTDVTVIDAETGAETVTTVTGGNYTP